jgi:hypothetical protein
MGLPEPRLFSENIFIFFHSSRGLSLRSQGAMSAALEYLPLIILDDSCGPCVFVEITNRFGVTEE